MEQIKKFVKTQTFINIVILGIMVLVSVLYAYKIGLLFCGYFFADDHEIARMHGGIVRDGLWKTMATWIEADTNLRFRPAYWVFRVFESYICGTRVVLWHFIKACEIGLCAWAGFLFARKMKATYLTAVIFGVVGFFGTQCAVVYRLGPQEPQALIWLLFGLVCAANYIEGSPDKKSGAIIRKRGWVVGFHIFMTLMMLTKESFLILAPVCVFFLLYLELQKIYAEEEKLLSAIIRVLKIHWLTVLYEAIVCVAGLCVIAFHSGVSSTGYAGLDASYSGADYLQGMWNIWTGELNPYMLLFLVTLIVNLALCVLHRKEKGYVFYRICEVFIALYFILSQSLLHAKTGMSERYLFPCITGILIYVCCLSLPRMMRDATTKKVIWQIALSAWAVWIVASSQFHALCLNYVFTCSNNTQMLIRLSELVAERGGEDCKIIVSTQFGEWNLALCAFMEELYGVDETYALSQNDSANNIAEDRYVINNAGTYELTIPEADIYVAQKEFLPIKMQDCGMEYWNMEQEVFGNYIVFIK